MRIDLGVTGDQASVAPEVSRAAYRIVQEGLTNVIKHAGAAPTRVEVVVGDETVEISVTNGPPSAGAPQNGDPPVAGGGRGLAGVRERAAILGGVVEAGPTDEGGYRLWARLPRDGA
jgi:signal transduction histidine kinase